MDDKTFSKFFHPTGHYAFRDLGKATTPAEELEQVESIHFAGFDSIEQGMWLLERSSPTPAEKEIIDSVPYQQGEYDFSMLDNQRYFEARELEYKLLVIDRDYHYRSSVEHEIKRQLMPCGYDWLEDTHINGYAWRAKCTGVSVEDSAEDGTLIATISFKADPFAYTVNPDGADVWDDVNFDHWICQDVKFTVDGEQTITIRNIGSTVATLYPRVTGSIKLDGLELTAKTNGSTTIVLEVGKNEFKVSGHGTINFDFRREEMI